MYRCEICGGDHGECDFIACRDALAAKVQRLEEKAVEAWRNRNALGAIAAGAPRPEDFGLGGKFDYESDNHDHTDAQRWMVRCHHPSGAANVMEPVFPTCGEAEAFAEQQRSDHDYKALERMGLHYRFEVFRPTP